MVEILGTLAEMLPLEKEAGTKEPRLVCNTKKTSINKPRLPGNCIIYITIRNRGTQETCQAEIYWEIRNPPVLHANPRMHA